MLEEAISVGSPLVWGGTLMLGYSDMEEPGMGLEEISEPVGYTGIETDKVAVGVTGNPYPGGVEERRQMVVVSVV